MFKGGKLKDGILVVKIDGIWLPILDAADHLAYKDRHGGYTA